MIAPAPSSAPGLVPGVVVPLLVVVVLVGWSGLGLPLRSEAPFTQMYGALALKVRVIWNLAAVATEAVAMDARLSATGYLPGGDLARCPLRLLVQKCRIGDRLDVRLPHWRQCSCPRRGCRWICCGSRCRVNRNGRTSIRWGSIFRSLGRGNGLVVVLRNGGWVLLHLFLHFFHLLLLFGWNGAFRRGRSRDPGARRLKGKPQCKHQLRATQWRTTANERSQLVHVRVVHECNRVLERLRLTNVLHGRHRGLRSCHDYNESECKQSRNLKEECRNVNAKVACPDKCTLLRTVSADTAANSRNESNASSGQATTCNRPQQTNAKRGHPFLEWTIAQSRFVKMQLQARDLQKRETEVGCEIARNVPPPAAASRATCNARM